MSETTIYLHGDAANWIRSGLEYLSNAVFVLDPYHKNKYLRQSVRDMGEKATKKYKELLFSALRDGDKERFAALSAEILKASAKTRKSKKRKAVPFSLGLPDPAQAVSLPARSGKVTSLFNALRPFWPKSPTIT